MRKERESRLIGRSNKNEEITLLHIHRRQIKREMLVYSRHYATIKVNSYLFDFTWYATSH